MASITRESNGRRTIQFTGPDKRRRSLRLGKVSQRMAEAVKVRIERLIASKITNHALDDETAHWLADLDLAMQDKLASVGLISPRESATLESFIDTYITGRTDAKPTTITTFSRAKNKLISFFDSNAKLRDFTPGDADDFARWLRDPQGGVLSEATARKTISIAKQFFRSAQRKKLIAENPFADLSGTVPANRNRDYFVSREETELVLEACPDAEWRLLFALSRYGGLRCPSETLGLKWQDIDWANDRMTIHSPKTEHHDGGASRIVPIFPELLPYLREAFEKAQERTEYVIARYRSAATNLRTQLQRIIRRAGLTPWPKLWQNLRATRETELAEHFPAHVVSSWIGNSVAVAAKHYLQVTDAHFEKATQSALQNPVQHPAATACTASQQENSENHKCIDCNEVRKNAAPCENTEPCLMGDKGL